MINEIVTDPGVVPIIIVQQSEQDGNWLSLRKIRTDTNSGLVEIRLSPEVIVKLASIFERIIQESK